MARKRLIEAPSEADGPQEEEDVADVRNDRDIAIEGTWKEWFFRVFLKYCYSIGVLFIACVVPLEVVRQLDGSTGLGLAFISVLLIVPAGLFGYLKLWGDGGAWGPEAFEEI